MGYIHRAPANLSVLIDEEKHPLIIYTGESFSVVARNYLDENFPQWSTVVLPTKANNLTSASGKMNSLGIITKKPIIPHRKLNIRLEPELLVLNNSQVRVYILGKYYHKMYGIDICNSKNRKLTFGTDKKEKFSFYIHIIQSPTGLALETLLKEFKIKGHEIGLFLDVERTYPPILRRFPYPARLETRKEIEKHINELLDMEVIKKIGHNEIVEVATPVLITWNYGKYRLFRDFRAMNNYKKAERYPIPRIPHALDKLDKAKFITKMYCVKGFHQNEVIPSSIKLLGIICHMGIYEYTRIPFGIKNAPAHFKRIMDNIFEKDIWDGWIVVYIDDIIIHSLKWENNVKYLDRVLGKFTSKNLKISLKKCHFSQQELFALGHKVSGLRLEV
ncbi:hypothetical protein O181_006867 [Austropuccinia psidii MF-1]|uniref:Reverse transcriptase domain-containing protein n=1 Tax=Austropuccinia psidii MF-1 TaxID=1389203 RepID=A0A9Q3BKU1_9BASI|nr:hypothetical protein [Austropuccinia psidii MF-1]